MLVLGKRSFILLIFRFNLLYFICMLYFVLSVSYNYETLLYYLNPCVIYYLNLLIVLPMKIELNYK